jgi:DNA-binding MarR family transcriptional regulator
MYQKFLMNLRQLRMIETRMAPKETKDKGISYMHMFWLFQATKDEAVPISQLKDAFNISASAATQFVNAWEKAGYVKRIRNPHDQRSSLISLSSKGIETITNAQKQMETQWLELSKYLGEVDTMHLYRITEKMISFCNIQESNEYEKEEN